MAHFAELDEENQVARVLVVGDNITIVGGVEDEQRGIDFLNDLLPGSGTWIQTSYNRSLRGRYAGIEYTYDPTRDVFVAPQPFPSWTLNEDTTEWEPPTPCPTGLSYWDEDTTSWVETT